MEIVFIHKPTLCLNWKPYINNTFNKGGTVIIPSFAVERVQTMMYLIWQLKKEERIPNIPYIIDTPMGISVLDVFKDNRTWHKLIL
jgi:metallo-beta-lactamase family protein